MLKFTKSTLLLLIFLSINSLGNNCTSTFPDAISSASSEATLILQNTAQISSSPDNILDTVLSNFDAGSSCGAGSCGVSGAPVPSVTYSDGFSGGSNLVTSSNSSVNNYSPGSYGSLNSGSNRSMTLSPGSYTFSTTWNFFHNVNVSLSSTGTVRMYFNGDISIGRDVKINTAGGANRLLIYTNGNITINTGAEVNAIIYAKGSVTTSSNSTFTGAITAEGDVTLAASSTATFDSSLVNNLDFDGLCPVPPAGVSGFSFAVSTATASACFPIEVTITALNSSGGISTSYTGSINLTAMPSNGTWSKTGIASNANGLLTQNTPDSGTATYMFDASDNGQIVLNYAYDRIGEVDLTVAGNGISAQVNNINFADNRFVFIDADGNNKDIIAHRPTNFIVQLWKYDLSASSGAQCGINTRYNVDNVKAWISRTFKDPGGITPTLTNASNTTFTPPATIPASTNFAANFVNGQASVTLSSTDVGSMTLHFADQSATFSSGEITGTTDEITVRPFGFDITVPNNPGAANHAQGAFKRAGETFEVSVRVVGWQAADDVNNDGMPDGHDDTDPTNNADLTNNPSLVSFGNENTAEKVRLRGFKRIHEPNTTNVLVNSRGSGSASRFSAFTNGLSTRTDVRYGDVGILELEASILGDEYIDASVATTTKMNSRFGFVGRFYPFEFTLKSVDLTPACSAITPFSYMGQPFNVSATLEVRNAFGKVLGNYYDDFAKLSGDESDVTFGVINQQNNDDLSSRFEIVSAAPINWTGSEGTINLTMRETRLLSPDGPFSQLELGILPTDSDGVTLADSDLDFDLNIDSTSDFASLGVFEQRFGRLRLTDAFAAEGNDLPAPFFIEYFDASRWTVNLDDSCTQVPYSAINYPQGSIDNIANRTVSIGAGQTTGSYTQTNTTSIIFTLGHTEHFFSAPGSGNTGDFEVDIDLSTLSWLGFDWDSDGDYNEVMLPSAQYSFGSYRGHDRVIYWQETID